MASSMQPYVTLQLVGIELFFLACSLNNGRGLMFYSHKNALLEPLVEQVDNLLFGRLAVGSVADCQSATHQTARLRYRVAGMPALPA